MLRAKEILFLLLYVSLVSCVGSNSLKDEPDPLLSLIFNSPDASSQQIDTRPDRSISSEDESATAKRRSIDSDGKQLSDTDELMKLVPNNNVPISNGASLIPPPNAAPAAIPMPEAASAMPLAAATPMSMSDIGGMVAEGKRATLMQPDSAQLTSLGPIDSSLDKKSQIPASMPAAASSESYPLQLNKISPNAAIRGIAPHVSEFGETVDSVKSADMISKKSEIPKPETESRKSEIPEPMKESVEKPEKKDISPNLQQAPAPVAYFEIQQNQQNAYVTGPHYDMSQMQQVPAPQAQGFAPNAYQQGAQPFLQPQQPMIQQIPGDQRHAQPQPPPVDSDEHCDDQYATCEDFAKNQYCVNYPELMKIQCRKSCQYCVPKVQPASTTTESATAKDTPTNDESEESGNSSGSGSGESLPAESSGEAVKAASVKAPAPAPTPAPAPVKKPITAKKPKASALPITKAAKKASRKTEVETVSPGSGSGLSIGSGSGSEGSAFVPDEEADAKPVAPILTIKIENPSKDSHANVVKPVELIGNNTAPNEIASPLKKSGEEEELSGESGSGSSHVSISAPSDPKKIPTPAKKAPENAKVETTPVGVGSGESEGSGKDEVAVVIDSGAGAEENAPKLIKKSSIPKHVQSKKSKVKSSNIKKSTIPIPEVVKKHENSAYPRIDLKQIASALAKYENAAIELAGEYPTSMETDFTRSSIPRPGSKNVDPAGLNKMKQTIEVAKIITQDNQKRYDIPKYLLVGEKIHEKGGVVEDNIVGADSVKSVEERFKIPGVVPNLNDYYAETGKTSFTDSGASKKSKIDSGKKKKQPQNVDPYEYLRNMPAGASMEPIVDLHAKSTIESHSYPLYLMKVMPGTHKYTEKGPSRSKISKKPEPKQKPNVVAPPPGSPAQFLSMPVPQALQAPSSPMQVAPAAQFQQNVPAPAQKSNEQMIAQQWSNFVARQRQAALPNNQARSDLRSKMLSAFFSSRNTISQDANVGSGSGMMENSDMLDDKFTGGSGTGSPLHPSTNLKDAVSLSSVLSKSSRLHPSPLKEMSGSARNELPYPEPRRLGLNSAPANNQQSKYLMSNLEVLSPDVGVTSADNIAKFNPSETMRKTQETKWLRPSSESELASIMPAEPLVDTRSQAKLTPANLNKMQDQRQTRKPIMIQRKGSLQQVYKERSKDPVMFKTLVPHTTSPRKQIIGKTVVVNLQPLRQAHFSKHFINTPSFPKPHMPPIALKPVSKISTATFTRKHEAVQSIFTPEINIQPKPVKEFQQHPIVKHVTSYHPSEVLHRQAFLLPGKPRHPSIQIQTPNSNAMEIKKHFYEFISKSLGSNTDPKKLMHSPHFYPNVSSTVVKSEMQNQKLNNNHIVMDKTHVLNIVPDKTFQINSNQLVKAKPQHTMETLHVSEAFKPSIESSIKGNIGNKANPSRQSSSLGHYTTAIAGLPLNRLAALHQINLENQANIEHPGKDNIDGNSARISSTQAQIKSKPSEEFYQSHPSQTLPSYNRQSNLASSGPASFDSFDSLSSNWDRNVATVDRAFTPPNKHLGSIHADKPGNEYRLSAILSSLTKGSGNHPNEAANDTESGLLDTIESTETSHPVDNNGYIHYVDPKSHEESYERSNISGNIQKITQSDPQTVESALLDDNEDRTPVNVNHVTLKTPKETTTQNLFTIKTSPQLIPQKIDESQPHLPAQKLERGPKKLALQLRHLKSIRLQLDQRKSTGDQTDKVFESGLSEEDSPQIDNGLTSPHSSLTNTLKPGLTNNKATNVRQEPAGVEHQATDSKTSPNSLSNNGYHKTNMKPQVIPENSQHENQKALKRVNGEDLISPISLQPLPRGNPPSNQMPKFVQPISKQQDTNFQTTNDPRPVHLTPLNRSPIPKRLPSAQLSQGTVSNLLPATKVNNGKTVQATSLNQKPRTETLKQTVNKYSEGESLLPPLERAPNPSNLLPPLEHAPPPSSLLPPLQRAPSPGYLLPSLNKGKQTPIGAVQEANNLLPPLNKAPEASRLLPPLQKAPESNSFVLPHTQPDNNKAMQAPLQPNTDASHSPQYQYNKGQSMGAMDRAAASVQKVVPAVQSQSSLYNPVNTMPSAGFPAQALQSQPQSPSIGSRTPESNHIPGESRQNVGSSKVNPLYNWKQYMSFSGPPNSHIGSDDVVKSSGQAYQNPFGNTISQSSTLPASSSVNVAKKTDQTIKGPSVANISPSKSASSHNLPSYTNNAVPFHVSAEQLDTMKMDALKAAYRDDTASASRSSLQPVVKQQQRGPDFGLGVPNIINTVPSHQSTSLNNGVPRPGSVVSTAVGIPVHTSSEVYKNPKKKNLIRHKPDLDCGEGWEGATGDFGTFCYKMMNMKVNFDDALKQCKKIKSNLFSVLNAYENRYLADNFHETFWIGYRDKSMDGSWNWTDNSRSIFTNWDNGGERDDNNRRDCVIVDSKQGSWKDQGCSDKYEYLCKQKKGTECRKGWKKLKLDSISGCYRMFKEKKSWEEAEQSCSDNEGHLASVLSQEEQTMLYQVYSSSSFWIGYNDRESEGDWLWSDRTTSSYTNWDEKSPNNGGISCAAVTSSGKWHDESCTASYPFMCKRRGPKGEKLDGLDDVGVILPVSRLLSKSSTAPSFEYDNVSISGPRPVVPLHYWPLLKTSKNGMQGNRPLGIHGSLVTVPGGIALDGVKTFMDAGDFHAKCVSDPDRCAKGFAVAMQILLDNSTLSYTTPHYILDSSGGSNGFSVFILQNRLNYKVVTQNLEWSVTTDVTINHWQDIVMTWDRFKGLSIYVNGAFKDSQIEGRAISNLTSDSFTRLLIGRQNNDVKPYTYTKAIIASVAFFTKHLSVEDVPYAFTYDDTVVATYRWLMPRPTKQKLPGAPEIALHNKVKDLDGGVYIDGQEGWLEVSDFDVCLEDPSKCRHGFSLSFKLKLFQEVREYKEPRYILDTGGNQEGTKGISVYIVNDNVYFQVVMCPDEDILIWTVRIPLYTVRWQRVVMSWRLDKGLWIYLDGQFRGLTKTPRTLPIISAQQPRQFVIGRKTTGPDYQGAQFGISSLSFFSRFLRNNETLNIFGGLDNPYPGIIREVWVDVPGSTLKVLKAHSDFPNNPTDIEIIENFDSPFNIEKEYGSKVKGYFVAPETGNYTFYMACSKACELYFSTEEEAKNKTKIIELEKPTLHNEWNKYLNQSSIPVFMVAGKYYYLEGIHKGQDVSDSLSVGVRMPSGRYQRPISKENLQWRLSGNPYAGIVREVWLDVPGYQVSDMTSDPSFPNNPTSTEILDKFDAPFNVADNYGSRLSGYFRAPQTGDYRFYLSSDSSGELWISSDENEENLAKIITLNGWTDHNEWLKYPEQKSEQIYLVAGRYYYIRAYHKAEKLADCVSTAVELPSGHFEGPIKRKHLSWKLQGGRVGPGPRDLTEPIPKPVGLYKLNQATLKDVVDGKNTMLIHNVDLTTGPNGIQNSAFLFHGKKDSYVELPNEHSKLDTKGGITILSNIYPTGTDGPIFNYRRDGLGVHMWQYDQTQLFVRFVSRDGNMSTQPLATRVLQMNQWNHVGATYNKYTGVSQLWHDGKMVKSRNIGEIKLATQYDVRVGAIEGDDRYFAGKINCIQVYSTGLTEQQIGQLRECPKKDGEVVDSMETAGQTGSGSESISEDTYAMENRVGEETEEELIGATIKDKVNKCEPSPCQNGGKCVNDDQKVDGFKCHCTSDFTGRFCQVSKPAAENPVVKRMKISSYPKKISSEDYARSGMENKPTVKQTTLSNAEDKRENIFLLFQKLGCYKDNVNQRDLINPARLKATSQEECARACALKDKGYAYFGLQNGKDCYCDKKFGRYGHANNNNCNIPCSGNGLENCGGKDSNLVFFFGLGTNYTVETFTGKKPGSGTDAKVFVELIGDRGSSDFRSLNSKLDRFEPGSIDKDTLLLPELGQLKKVRVLHDNTGTAPSWFLDKVKVTDEEGKSYEFPCNDWLSETQGGGKLERDLSLKKNKITMI